MSLLKPLSEVGIRKRLVALRLWSKIGIGIAILIVFADIIISPTRTVLPISGAILGMLLFFFYYFYNWASSTRDIHKGANTDRWYDEQMSTLDYAWISLPVVLALLGALIGIFL